MELKKCKGIVIDSRDFRDNRHIHTLFTDILGKIQLISSGSRKIRSENRESLLLLSRSEFMLKPGRNFWGVRGTDLEKSFQVLEYENYTLAVNIINILNKVIPPDFIDERIYILTVHYIDFIEKSQTDMHELIRLTFVMKLLYFLGQFPGLDKCECGSMSGEEFYACTRDSSLICEKCKSDRYIGSMRFSRVELASLQMLLRWNYEEIDKDRYPGFSRISEYFAEYLSWNFHISIN